MDGSINQFPEQAARDNIDKQLRAAGWAVQDKDKIDWNESIGIAIRGYQTDVGPTDHVLFVERRPVGIIEAKKEEEGLKLISHEPQAENYATSKLKYLNNDPLPFVYESTGILTRFTDYRDPKPRSRPVFTFHMPETFKAWLKEGKSLRARLLDIPGLPEFCLRNCQIKAINNLEKSFKENKPRAFVQMASGAGKTYTAITSNYRLLKFANAKRILFLVDTIKLGEQAEQEFMAYQPTDDNRKFTELYNVQRLSSNYISPDSQVCISTIQRLYSILKGEELDEETEEINPNEKEWEKKEPMPVVYDEKIPIEHFDFIVIDECHRSIYGKWKQVLEYFDAFLIGLTATPDKRTFGFFNENVVSEYLHEEAVADGVNVKYDVYIIETEISQNGAILKANEYVDKRERLNRKKRWEQLDEDVSYSKKDLDKDIVNPSQIRNIIRAFKNKWPEIFPGRKEVPKTLIFAKTDSHADDIIQIVREEFNEGNEFCKKITYKTKDEDPKSILNQFRTGYNPRIAVTVAMISVGIDVKPLECLLFMRDVKSKSYFEQMKGRGTRTFGYDDLKKVTPSAVCAKTHFVVVDAVGVSKSIKTDSRPLERKRSTSMKDLLNAVTMGAKDEDLFTSLAGRLAMMEKQLTDREKETFTEKAKGKTINQTVKDLLDAYNPDRIEEKAQELKKENPKITEKEAEGLAKENLIKTASSTFSGDLNGYIENVRRVHEQIIDTVNIDKVTKAEWEKDTDDKAREIVNDFSTYIKEHKDEIVALSIFYNLPYKLRELTSSMVKDVLEKLKLDKPMLAPLHVWHAYEQLEDVKGSPKSELVALVSLIRRVTGVDSKLTTFDLTVDRNFQKWVFEKQAGALKFNEEQMNWLRMMKEHIATSFHIEVDDLDYTPFDAHGGRGMMFQLFGSGMKTVIGEMNEAMAV